ncbi:MAG: transcriptional regulator [Clostridiaceae bacterium]|jgi:transcriptional regulator with XRE-family HTH domain|nr:transcriptional regulator [Clostridiaceae bacterium]
MFDQDTIENIKFYMNKKGWTKYKLAKEAGIGQSTLSEILSGKKKNPSINSLQKIADALNVPVSDFFIDRNEPSQEKIYEEYCNEERTRYGESSFSDEIEFRTPEAAMKFILNQKAIMGFGGFDTNKMTDEEIMDFANELLNQLKLLGYKYKR